MKKVKLNGGELKFVINKVMSEAYHNKQSREIVNESKQKLGNLIESVVRSVINEWKPNSNFDVWANLETGGAHGRGIQHRKNFTRKENAKNEKTEDIKTPTDFRRLIIQLGDDLEQNTEKIYNAIIKKYKSNDFKLHHVESIASFSPILHTEISKMLIDFVDEENKKVKHYPDNFRRK